MAKHSKHRGGCDCLITQPATPQADDGVCMPSDPENTGTGTGTPGPENSTHCAYVALPLCNLFTASGEKYGEPCIVLQKRCVTGNEYDSPWNTNANPTSDSPRLQLDGCESLLDPSGGMIGELCLVACPGVAGWRVEIISSSCGTVPYVQCLPFNRGVGSFTGAKQCCAFGGYEFGFDPYFLWVCEDGTARILFSNGQGAYDFATWDCAGFSGTIVTDQSCTIEVSITPVDAEWHGGVSVCDEGSGLVIIGGGGITGRNTDCCSLAANYLPECGNSAQPSITTGTGTITQGAAGTGTGTAGEDCFVKWRLTGVPDGYSTLEVFTRDGESALFSDSNWKSNRWRTFSRESMSDGLAGLPKCICVGPIDTGYTSPCDPAVKQCNCCLDFRCPTFLQLAICGRSPVNVPLSIIWSPGDTGTGGFPCGVSDPGAPCPVYWGTYDLGADACDDFDQLGFLVWCDGGDVDPWHVYVYCHKISTDCWVFQEDAIDTQECMCNGEHFTFSFEAECICCCPPCEDLPDTLPVTSIGGILCGCAFGAPVSGSLTRTGPTTWTGTFAFGTCGKNVTLTFTCATPCESATLDVSFSDACDGPFTLTPTNCSCTQWEFITGDLVSCIDAGGPCAVSFLIG